MKSYLKPAVAITSILTIIINLLANIVPYNGLQTAQISDSFKVYFVPAGYVFAIWGVIYIGMLVYLYYIFKNKNETFDKAAPYIIISNIANSAWIFVWHYLLFDFSVPLILVLLVSLIQVFMILKSDKSLNQNFTSVPYGIYLGWASVATIANITAFLDYHGIKSLVFDGPTWSALLIIIAGVLGYIFLRRYKQITYPLVIIWAVTGIAVKFSSIDIINYTAVIIAVLLMILIISNIIIRSKVRFIAR